MCFLHISASAPRFKDFSSQAAEFCLSGFLIDTFCRSRGIAWVSLCGRPSASPPGGVCWTGAPCLLIVTRRAKRPPRAVDLSMPSWT